MLNYAHFSKTPLQPQRGAATLITALILLLAITLVTFSAARVGVTEQRTSINDVRAKTAQEVAQAAVEYGYAYLDKNHSQMALTAAGGWWGSWVACTASDTAVPCGDGNNHNLYNAAGPGYPNWVKYTVPIDKAMPVGATVSGGSAYTYALYYLAPCVQDCGGVAAVPADNSTVVIVANVTSTDPLAGSAQARLVVRGYSSLARIPSTPLMAAGLISTNGNMSIWGNATGIPTFVAAPANNPNVTEIALVNPPPAQGVSYTATAFNTTPSQNGGNPKPTPNNLKDPTSYDQLTATSTAVVNSGDKTTTTVTTGTPLSVWVKDLNGNGLSDDGSEVRFQGAANGTCRNLQYVPGSSCNRYELTNRDVNQTQRFDVVAGTRIAGYQNGQTFCEPFPGTVPPYPDAPRNNPAAALPNITPLGTVCNVFLPPDPDMFSYAFGVVDAQRDLIKYSLATTIISNCTGLAAKPPGRYWVTGECSIGADNIGSRTSPYVLIIDGAALHLNGNGSFWGFIYSRGTAGSAPIELNGGFTLYGALISDHNIEQVNGTFNSVYDADVLLRAGQQTGGFSRLSGGWIDQLK